MTEPIDDFDELVAEADAADVSGWGFGWLDGRATEERPSWGYQRVMAARLAAVASALDLETGVAATEAHPPNLALATQRLHPRGVVVVRHPDAPPLPFADGAFDLVTSRHPAAVWWTEIARVLRPGGTYLAQHVGPESLVELYEWFLGPQPGGVHHRHPQRESAQAEAAGLRVLHARMERLRVELFDVGAVVYLLRKVIWIVPGFDSARYRERLRELHERIRRDGSFVTYSTRVLFEAQART
jgi:SAM-dependent methyltransferase